MSNDFGQKIKEARIDQGLSLRKASRLSDHDASNWSKMERGIIPPPPDKEDIEKMLKVLGIKKNEYQEWIDKARVAQQAIPEDIKEKDANEYLPAFFRTLRGDKPTKKEADKLIKLIKKS